jgi:proline racemase
VRLAKVIHCVDAHAEGEPSRIIVGGVLDVPGTTMLEKARHLEREADWLRRLVLFEPRGSAPLSGDLVLPSSHPEADAGFIIMESSSYEGMSGTNAINTAAVLLETGLVEMVEPVTKLTLEAPAGLVRVTADCAGGRVERITFENVLSFATHLGAAVEVPGLGALRVDVAYGGAFAAFVDAEALGFAIVPDEARELAELGERIRPHVVEQLEIAHPLQAALGYLSFVVFVAPALSGGDARHATIVSPGRLDRSPTGTATSARMAVLAAQGKLGEGGTYVAESVLDTRFSGRVVRRAKVGDTPAIVPAISGRAWITGFHQLVVDPSDPLAGGFTLPDTWGSGAREGTLNAAAGRVRPESRPAP